MDIDNSNKKIGTACDNGLITMIDSNSEKCVIDYTIHDYSVWCCLIDPQSPNIVYSGADDAKLCAFDTLANETIFDKKVGQYDSGICHIINNPIDANQIIVGSFDEYIRIYDKRHMDKSVFTKKLDGGVWRMAGKSQQKQA